MLATKEQQGNMTTRQAERLAREVLEYFHHDLTLVMHVMGEASGRLSVYIKKLALDDLNNITYERAHFRDLAEWERWKEGRRDIRRS